MTLKTTIVKTAFLNAIKKQEIPVSIFLMNGIKLQGKVTNFDERGVILSNNGMPQTVLMNGISSVVAQTMPKMKAEDMTYDESDFNDIEFAGTLKEQKIPSKIYLVNGVGLDGFILGYDESCYLLSCGSSTMQFVNYSAVSTVGPDPKKFKM